MALKTIAAAAICCVAANGAADIEARVQDALRAATVGGADARLDEVQAALAPTFQALPKNGLGRLESENVRHALHRYFTATHGWTVAGLEDAVLEPEALPLAARAQLAAEGARRSRGLALSDVAAVAVAVEDGLRGELRELLEASYTHSGFATDMVLDKDALQKVLTNYLGLLMSGGGDLDEAVAGNREVEALAAMPAAAAEASPAAAGLEAAAAAAERLLGAFARWQGWRCATTKATLQGLGGAEGPLLPALYRYGLATEGLPFTQSPEYLRQIGALDEVAGAAPRVRVANYMQGPANCLRATSDVSFCCPSECDDHVARIRGAAQGPVASAEQLAELLPGLRFEAGSDVELSGPGFAAALRSALPDVCPAPASPGALSVARWAGGREFATAAELAHYLSRFPAPAPAAAQPVETPVEEPARAGGASQLRAALRAAVMILIVGVSLRWISKALGGASAALSTEDAKAKKAKVA